MNITKSINPAIELVKEKKAFFRKNLFFKNKNAELSQYFERLDNAARSAISKGDSGVRNYPKTEKIKKSENNFKENFEFYAKTWAFGLKCKFLDSKISKFIPKKSDSNILNCLKRMEQAGKEVVEADKKQNPLRKFYSTQNEPPKQKNTLKDRFDRYCAKKRNDLSIKRYKKREEKMLKKLGVIEPAGQEMIRYFPGKLD